jgi:hypothetical protein
MRLGTCYKLSVQARCQHPTTGASGSGFGTGGSGAGGAGSGSGGDGGDGRGVSGYAAGAVGSADGDAGPALRQALVLQSSFAAFSAAFAYWRGAASLAALLCKLWAAD